MNILNNAQMKVFEEIVRQKSTIGKIAQGTGMHRQSVKIVINSLIRKRFVKKKKKANKIFYSAEDLKKSSRVILVL